MNVACGIIIAAYIQNYKLIDEFISYERKSIENLLWNALDNDEGKKKQKMTRRLRSFDDNFYFLLK